jgi:NADH-quinone oxidoreductase subunit G
VIAELALRVGLDLDVLGGTMASQRLFDAVPFYAGLTLEQIGGRGVRWQERDAASAFPGADAAAVRELAPEPAVPGEDATEPGPDAADLAGWRSVWDAPEVEYSPALEFLFPRTSAVLPLSYSAGGKT